MKKGMTILVFFLLVTQGYAQHFEVKLFKDGGHSNRYSLSGEYLANNNIGLELIPSYINCKSHIYNVTDLYKTTGAAVQVGVKYYFFPKRGCDRLGLGIYLETDSRTSKLVSFPKSVFKNPEESMSKHLIPGMSLVYKWVLKPRITIELGLDVSYYYTYSHYTVINNIKNTSNLFLGAPVLKDRIAIGYRFGGREVE